MGVRITGENNIRKCNFQNFGEYQNGLRDGRAVIDNLFLLKIINEKIREYN